jgi:hypothetical protein
VVAPAAVTVACQPHLILKQLALVVDLASLEQIPLVHLLWVKVAAPAAVVEFHMLKEYLPIHILVPLQAVAEVEFFLV